MFCLGVTHANWQSMYKCYDGNATSSLGKASQILKSTFVLEESITSLHPTSSLFLALKI